MMSPCCMAGSLSNTTPRVIVLLLVVLAKSSPTVDGEHWVFLSRADMTVTHLQISTSVTNFHSIGSLLSALSGADDGLQPQDPWHNSTIRRSWSCRGWQYFEMCSSGVEILLACEELLIESCRSVPLELLLDKQNTVQVAQSRECAHEPV